MNRRGFNSLLLGIGSLLACVGCSHSQKPARVEITLVAKAMDSEFWQSLRSSAQAAAAEHPEVKLTVLAPEREINIDQQVSIIDDQIVKKVDALIVAPTGASEILPVLNRANAAGIPVVIVDTDIPWPSKISYVGTNNRLGGKLAGEHLAKAMTEHGEVAVIRGLPGVATHEERVAGFREAIAQTPGIRCIAVQPANSERVLAMSVMENLLTTHPNLKGVFVTSDQMALGAIEAVSARRLEERVIVVGFDAVQEQVRAVQAGRHAAAVAQHPEMMGRRSVEEAIKAVRREPVEKRVDTGTTVVTRTNASQFLR